MPWRHWRRSTRRSSHQAPQPDERTGRRAPIRSFQRLADLDPRDPSLGSVRVLDDPQPEESQEEARRRDGRGPGRPRRRPRIDDPFALYIVDSEGPPVVHVSRTRRSEIVIFGRSQRLLPPIVLGTGAVLLNASEKDEEIEISKIVPSKFKDSDVKLRTSLELQEVIRRVANLGSDLSGTGRDSRRCEPATEPARHTCGWTRCPSPTWITCKPRSWARTPDQGRPCGAAGLTTPGLPALEAFRMADSDVAGTTASKPASASKDPDPSTTTASTSQTLKLLPPPRECNHRPPRPGGIRQLRRQPGIDNRCSIDCIQSKIPQEG